MPYEWIDSPNAPETRRLVAWPHRSLPRRGFVWFIGLTALMFLAPLIGVIGTPVLWVLLCAALFTIAAIWAALELSYRSGRITDDLEIDPDTIRLTHTKPNRKPQSWEAKVHWAAIDIAPTGGPVPHYVTLSGGHRIVELGVFLTSDERRAIYTDVQAALSDLRKTP